jgi:hypothetical protein
LEDIQVPKRKLESKYLKESLDPQAALESIRAMISGLETDLEKNRALLDKLEKLRLEQSQNKQRILEAQRQLYDAMAEDWASREKA